MNLTSFFGRMPIPSTKLRQNAFTPFSVVWPTAMLAIGHTLPHNVLIFVYVQCVIVTLGIPRIIHRCVRVQCVIMTLGIPRIIHGCVSVRVQCAIMMLGIPRIIHRCVCVRVQCVIMTLGIPRAGVVVDVSGSPATWIRRSHHQRQ